MTIEERKNAILAKIEEVKKKGKDEEQTKATEEIAAIVEEVYNSDMEVIENV